MAKAPLEDRSADQWISSPLLTSLEWRAEQVNWPNLMPPNRHPAHARHIRDYSFTGLSEEQDSCINPFEDKIDTVYHGYATSKTHNVFISQFDIADDHSDHRRDAPFMQRRWRSSSPKSKYMRGIELASWILAVSCFLAMLIVLVVTVATPSAILHTRTANFTATSTRAPVLAATLLSDPSDDAITRLAS